MQAFCCCFGRLKQTQNRLEWDPRPSLNGSATHGAISPARLSTARGFAQRNWHEFFKHAHFISFWSALKAAWLVCGASALCFSFQTMAGLAALASALFQSLLSPDVKCRSRSVHLGLPWDPVAAARIRPAAGCNLELLEGFKSSLYNLLQFSVWKRLAMFCKSLLARISQIGGSRDFAIVCFAIFHPFRKSIFFANAV